MKNLKIAKKLALSFITLIVLCVIIGSVGFIGIVKMEHANDELLDQQIKPIAELSQLIDHTQRLRIQIRNAALRVGRPELLAETENAMNTELEALRDGMVTYATMPATQEIKDIFLKANTVYENELIAFAQAVMAGAKNGMDREALQTLIEDKTVMIDTMVNDLKQCLDTRIEDSSLAGEKNHSMSIEMIFIIVGTVVVSIAVSAWLAVKLSTDIGGPLSTMSEYLENLGTTGDMALRQVDQENIEKHMNSKDEIGQCVRACSNLVYRLIEVGEGLGRIADCDLTVDMKVLSERDSLGIALNTMTNNLNDMLGEICIAAENVSTGAGAIAQDSQSLAAGATEQAASVEQFSSAIEAMEEQTRNNAENSQNAKESNNKAGQQLIESMQSMKQTLESMQQIEESSKKITQVIKVIDDIAFQTNILALNAAVEAARAGVHGKGFAVVAEEVRNLASKSADAAKETAGLIEESSVKVNEGRRAVERTNVGLETAMTYSKEAIRLVEEVAEASTSQASAIEELNIGMTQISEVVQGNSATSERSAAAAQQMSAQTVTFNEITSRFALKKGTQTVKAQRTLRI